MITLIDKYEQLGLIDKDITISREIIEEDLDFEDVIGRSLISVDIDHYLFPGSEKDDNYKELLFNIQNENLDLFFSSDVANKCLYFECLIGSKENKKKKYHIKRLIAKVKTSKCPVCNSPIKIQPQGNNPIVIDGVTEICTSYLIFCPKCGKFGEIGFKVLSAYRALLFETKKFLGRIKRINILMIGEIEIESNFPDIYRCKR
jgi:hypothetical protein